MRGFLELVRLLQLSQVVERDRRSLDAQFSLAGGGLSYSITRPVSNPNETIDVDTPVD